MLEFFNSYYNEVVRLFDTDLAVLFCGINMAVLIIQFLIRLVMKRKLEAETRAFLNEKNISVELRNKFKEFTEVQELFTTVSGKAYLQWYEQFITGNVSKLASVFISSSLASYFLKSIVSHNKKRAMNDSIVGIYVSQKIKRDMNAYAWMLVALVIYLCDGIIDNGKVEPIGCSLLLLLMVLIGCSQWLLEYRIRKGYFGNNAHEASDLLHFLAENSDQDDFIDRISSKRVLEEEKVDQIEDVWTGEVVR